MERPGTPGDHRRAMPITQADIDALDRAIADGVRQVTMPGGQSVTYNTTASLIAARDDLLARLAAQEREAEGKPRQRHTQLVFAGRGY